MSQLISFYTLKFVFVVVVVVRVGILFRLDLLDSIDRYLILDQTTTNIKYNYNQIIHIIKNHLYLII